MDQQLTEDRELRALLGSARTVAVVGLSPKEDRPSNRVARYLQRFLRVIPVNPAHEELLGERSYASLRDIPADVHVDIVDVFRRAEETPPIARDAVAIGASALWLQEGIVNDEAARIAFEGGLDVIMGICIEHTRRRVMEEP